MGIISFLVNEIKCIDEELDKRYSEPAPKGPFQESADARARMKLKQYLEIENEKDPEKKRLKKLLQSFGAYDLTI